MDERECARVRERLDAFVDQELDPVASREVADHLRGCPECERRAEALRALGEAVRREAPYHRAPERLRAALTARLDAATFARPPARRVARVPQWLAAAAALVVVAGGAWSIGALRGTRETDALAGQVIASHVRSLMPGHLTDVVSGEQHTVKPWFAGRIDFSPPVVDLAGEGFPLIGGRLDYVRDRPVAALVYGRRQHLINVFVWPAPGSPPSDARAITRQGYHLLHGVRGGMAYWAVSDLNLEELGEFVRRWR